jgi:Zn-dependent membrane protease YugP
VQSGYSGAQDAQAVMERAGVRGVWIKRHQGFLSDHYDPLAAVAVVVFQLITLPMEFNASNRVLDAAALTYVAAAAASLLQLIDLVLRQRR